MTVRTSASHPLRVDWIPCEGPGRLGLTIAPGKHQDSAVMGGRWERDLDVDLARLAELGTDVLVALLEGPEFARLQIPEEPAKAAARFRFLHFAIPDGGVPADRAAAEALADQLVAEIRGGASVVVHCAGGLGRSGTIAGMVLVRLGVDAEEALTRLAKRRSPNCPENSRQKDFVRQTAGPAA